MNLSYKNGLITIWMIIAILLLVLYSWFSISVLLVIFLIGCGILFEIQLTEHKDRAPQRRLLCTVASVYMITAVFSAYCFEDGKFFMMNDPTQYFIHLKMTTMDKDPLTSFVACYGLMNDNNEMHELFVRYCILFSNNYLDGASVIYLTLINVFFGVISVGAVFRILRKVVSKDKAFQYSLAFALLCWFHYYSISFVRDIIIACIYTHIIEMLLERFKFRNLILMLIFVFVVWGIRLYSGFFVVAFIAYYLFSLFSSKIGKKFVIVISAATLIAALPVVSKFEAVTKSAEEINNYQEFSAEHASSTSLAAKLESLPPVVREVSLILYTQISPFPSYIGTIDSAKDIFQFFLGLLCVICEFFWYIIAFGLLYMLFVEGGYKYLNIDDILLLGIICVFLYLNSSQIDMRRFMGVYPLILYYYLKTRFVFLKSVRLTNMNIRLISGYIVLLVIYMLLKL